MKNKLGIFASIAAAGCVAIPAPNAADQSETSIPFVGSNGILEWRAVADDTLYVRGYNGRWHIVRMSGACPRLRNATSIGFATSALGELDRFGQVLIEESSCPIASVTRSESPPRPKNRN
jgi:hypothetical protein